MAATARNPPMQQLSLFEAPPPLPASAAPARPDGNQPRAPEPGAGSRPPQAGASGPPPFQAPGQAPLSPPSLPAALSESPRFLHPRAQRSIVLGEHRVGYEFRRARRRSIGFVIGTEGLSVSAPRWVAVGEVEQALQAKADWILRKLHEQHERGARLEAARMQWREGACLPFLGDSLVLVIDPRITGVQLQAEPPGPPALPGVARRALHIGLPHQPSEAQLRETVQSWLQRQARRVFEERCSHFAPQLGVRVKRLSLSSAATRWGSASADGSVRLNWRLVHFALPVIDYVVAHELAHLREMNHSAAFWDVVRSVVPDYEHRRVALRTEVLPSFD